MNKTAIAVTVALSVALAKGMNEANAEQFTQSFILHMAANNLGMSAAAERASKICNKLVTRSADDVERTLLPSQRVSAGLTEDAKTRLLEEAATICDKITA